MFTHRGKWGVFQYVLEELNLMGETIETIAQKHYFLISFARLRTYDSSNQPNFLQESSGQIAWGKHGRFNYIKYHLHIVIGMRRWRGACQAPVMHSRVNKNGEEKVKIDNLLVA